MNDSVTILYTRQKSHRIYYPEIQRIQNQATEERTS
ncbi:hypothetical protein VA7868_00197 [Vibrio aerogenes CECT 7868]|uniref:Uncharacterized protein n=1 Tax=Vibrio aerogenes CECT 7868 TaxID=1216006 RepID=A0A1M5UX92_9VIBR|nr:hypothetical protein VA7868_00197 [Vibrio aerogenes CECT 7868]